MIAAILYAIPFLGQGLLVTLTVSALVVVLSLIIGGLLGIGLVYGPAPLRWVVRGFSDIIRGIPILVLLFFVYYGLPIPGLNLPPFGAAVFALTLFKTAQVIENVRGAIGSIPKGQMDAAKAIGLTFPKRLAYVIVPQAVRRFLPPWINGVTDAVKGSALVSLLGVVDAVRGAQIETARFADFTPYIVAALLFVALAIPTIRLADWVTARLRRREQMGSVV